MIDVILRREEFIENPPVLLDIGASGAIHQKWNDIAPYAIGIAFDADARDMDHVAQDSGGFKRLFVCNRVVTDRPSPELEFYLTRSPHCSSSLPPDQGSLDNWLFAELFEVERRVTLHATTLPEVLREAGVKKVDWFKSDSQGTDLRLFASLGEELVNKVLVAEFEPGIIDAYQGEDKLWQVLAYMDRQPFWMTSLDICGTERIQRTIYTRMLSELDRKNLRAPLKTSPCWGEVSYLHTFGADATYLDQRDFLLGWVFAVIEEQYGFALELAVRGQHRFSDPVFAELSDFSLQMMTQTPRPLFFKRIVKKLRTLSSMFTGS